MLSEGTAAPLFELPALVDGERQRVGLSDYLGEDVVILAFYPADFNPACDDTACDLDELDLFTMQKDVTILGISPDSVYSHRAFADRYDLKVPLLSDTDHDVAREYGLDFVDDIGQRLIERAVVVIDHDGDVQYAWSTADLQQLPRVGEIKDAIADTGGDDTAFARYRVGHAHYTEGRRAFTAAMGGFQESEWMVAQGDFQQAREEFDAAENHFDTAVRFVDDDSLKPVYEGAKTKANSLWQASDWLAQAARAYSSGDGAEGQELRDDAEGPLETARGYEEPPDPDGPWPPDLATLEKGADDDRPAFLPQDEDGADTSLGVDIDGEVERANQELAATGAAADGTPAESADDASPESTTSPDRDGDVSDVGDTDIEAIQAELAESEAETGSTGSLDEAPTAMVEATPDTVGGADDASPPDAGSSDATHASATAPDDSAELDLTDPKAADPGDTDTPAGDSGANGGTDPERDDEESDAESDRPRAGGDESDV
ncbi:redoxin domain-containing protein [Haloarcula sp. 1CSR25-25]|uniref:redoxin domain-containing protein n=1 Tax=Haloarcula sp. 1CSR25-25 TaxID=2862545 RepID=UPI002894C4AA|nr:redoxin domain-containing protein [Haloarcula sp. 1CSR25-25]MDT3434081.1 redoxin domain-containing protein [Haloarcula sp. 1CSR25-25]